MNSPYVHNFFRDQRRNTVLRNETVDCILKIVRLGCTDAYARRLALRGWEVYETSLDGSQFGVWTNPAAHQILTYSLGDLTLIVCASGAEFQAKLTYMNKVYRSNVLDLREPN